MGRCRSTPGLDHEGKSKERCRPEGRRYVNVSGQVDLGFGFDDEEGVGVGVAGGAEFLAGVVEGVG